MGGDQNKEEDMGENNDTCGSNEAGQLGIASRSISQMPKPIENFDKETIQVQCGKHHTLLLTSSGLVYGCGSNVEGQLGV